MHKGPAYRWLNLALKEAQKGDHKQKIGAVVFDKNRFISVGHNYSCRSIKNHLSKFRKWNTSLHAEVIAIINAKANLKGASILVVRVNTNGRLSLAKPCKKCMEYIKYTGIRKVFYSADGEIKLLKLNKEEKLL